MNADTPWLATISSVSLYNSQKYRTNFGVENNLREETSLTFLETRIDLECDALLCALVNSAESLSTFVIAGIGYKISCSSPLGVFFNARRVL